MADAEVLNRVVMLIKVRQKRLGESCFLCMVVAGERKMCRCFGFPSNLPLPCQNFFFLPPVEQAGATCKQSEQHVSGPR